MVEKGLVLDSGLFLMAYPVDTPARKVTISNIPPFLKGELIAVALAKYGTIVLQMLRILLGIKHNNAKHVMSFRSIYMVLKNRK